MTKVIAGALIILALLLLASGVLLRYQKNVIVELKAERTQLQIQNTSHVIKARANQLAYDELSNQKTAISQAYQDLQQRINDAPESDNAPLAPVLKSALEGLQ